MKKEQSAIFASVALGILSAMFLLLTHSLTSSFIVNGGQEDIGFPFELREVKSPDPPTWHAVIVLSSHYYSKENLDRLFLWYSKKHPNKEEALAIAVYTDQDRLRSYLADPDDDVSRNDRMPRPKRDGAAWDAHCWRGGDGLAPGAGNNLLYTYSPNLNSRLRTKRVILRGQDYASARKITETWEAKNNAFKIHVDAYDLLMDTEPTSKYYTFSAVRSGSDELKAILTIRQDQATPIPRNQVVLLNDQIGYVFMGWLYAVTTDGAKTWRKWDAEMELPNWQCCDSGLIQNVQIRLDGFGVMTLKLPPQRSEGILTLRTNDYGQHWIIDKNSR